jgi:hypothetical protein
VLLGDDGPDGWGIKYAREFDMTNDSKLFPARPKWEAQGYRPDEYSRWLKGNWRPIAELWAEMRVDPTRPVPLDPECEALLREADVIRGDHPVRCAQPPYDRIPVPRADIREGIMLSREADAFIREGDIEKVALPLYEGRMIGQFDFCQKGWQSGKGRTAVWRDVGWEDKVIDPQYLIEAAVCLDSIQDSLSTLANEEHWTKDELGASRAEGSVRSAWSLSSRQRVGFIDVTSATNTRTTFASLVGGLPCGNSTPVLDTSRDHSGLMAILNSWTFDMVARFRCGGLHLNWFVIAEAPLPQGHEAELATLSRSALRLGAASVGHAVAWSSAIADQRWPWRRMWAITPHERIRLRAMIDAGVALIYGLERRDLEYLLRGTDWPIDAAAARSAGDSKGFWRADKNIHPECRHAVLTIVAFDALIEKIAQHGLSKAEALSAYFDGGVDGAWAVPDGLTLRDYGLGLDERSTSAQPVARVLGKRLADWQLAQSAEESWRECSRHCHNIAGMANPRSSPGGPGQLAESLANAPLQVERDEHQKKLF